MAPFATNTLPSYGAGVGTGRGAAQAVGGPGVITPWDQRPHGPLEAGFRVRARLRLPQLVVLRSPARSACSTAKASMSVVRATRTIRAIGRRRLDRPGRMWPGSSWVSRVVRIPGSRPGLWRYCSRSDRAMVSPGSQPHARAPRALSGHLSCQHVRPRRDRELEASRCRPSATPMQLSSSGSSARP